MVSCRATQFPLLLLIHFSRAYKGLGCIGFALETNISLWLLCFGLWCLNFVTFDFSLLLHRFDICFGFKVLQYSVDIVVVSCQVVFHSSKLQVLIVCQSSCIRFPDSFGLRATCDRVHYFLWLTFAFFVTSMFVLELCQLCWSWIKNSISTE